MDYDRVVDNLLNALATVLGWVVMIGLVLLIVLVLGGGGFALADFVVEYAEEKCEQPLKGILIVLGYIIALLPIADMAALLIWAFTH
ncbi:hypothetical protein N7478_004332 [Penicillium angulare]|uniref:uncharacterized protein n=1 Tax=Penicillium angulare TaxID=116970 RepID=UPI00254108A0|nr:uncharacterized protein N7478_004332 [Penicillium angulare]KAJ5278960.1 hypothetical protein N7478_004332 [Penicillium angulare]